jgi:hypothetical protein
LEKALYMSKRRIQSGLTEIFTRLLIHLFCKVIFETNRLLEMKALETPVFVVLIKPAQSFSDGISRCFALPFGLFKKYQIFSLYTLVFWIVF